MPERGARRLPRRAWPVVVVFAAMTLAALFVAGCDRPAAPTLPALWLPGFAAQTGAIDKVTLRAAGDVPAIELQRDGAVWRVPAKGGWPAEPGRVEGLLDELAAARPLEAKTTHPDRYARLGVAPIATPGSDGVQLELAGAASPRKLLLGHAHGDAQRFVRVDGDAQAWLVDQALPTPPRAEEWLDTRLVDVPLARIARVEVRNADGHDFDLEHRDDRFRVVGVPSAAMGEGHGGDALAGVLDHLQLDDVAADDGKAHAERTVRFIAHDGSWIELAAWRIDGQVWVRGTDSGAGELMKAWSHRDELRDRRFRLPAFQAAILMRGRSQVLDAR
jgi:hypothetical protein